MEVTLRKWNNDDKEALKTLCNTVDRSYLSDRLPNPYTDGDAERWLHMVEEHEAKDGIFRAILADGKVVGNISVEKKADVYSRDGEIGYMLATDLWSAGIMTEAVRQLCPEAFVELDLLRITGLVYEPNTASRRVLEKNNFVLEGIMKKAVFKNNSVYNLCVYGKLR